MPGSTVILCARLMLAAGAVAATTFLIGPLEGVGRLAFLSSKEAHILAFFCLTVLSFIAAPQVRKNDLALAAFSLACAAELAQAAVGRQASVLDMLAGSAGILMAWTPAYAEALRRRVVDPNWRDRRRPRLAPAAKANSASATGA